MDFIHEVRWEAAWSRRDPDPAKDYGQHGVDLSFIVRIGLQALEFKVFTHWALSGLLQHMVTIPPPLPVGVFYHSPRPLNASDRYYEHCRILGQDCYTPTDFSSLEADGYFTVLTDQGEEAFWALMEARWIEVFGAA